MSRQGNAVRLTWRKNNVGDQQTGPLNICLQVAPCLDIIVEHRYLVAEIFNQPTKGVCQPRVVFRDYDPARLSPIPPDAVAP